MVSLSRRIIKEVCPTALILANAKGKHQKFGGGNDYSRHGAAIIPFFWAIRMRAKPNYRKIRNLALLNFLVPVLSLRE